MKENAKRNGMDDLSHYLRTLALAPIKLSLSISVPNVIEVSEAELKSGGEIRKEHKRAAG